MLARLGGERLDELQRVLERLPAEQLDPQMILRQLEIEMHPRLLTGILACSAIAPACEIRVAE